MLQRSLGRGFTVALAMDASLPPHHNTKDTTAKKCLPWSPSTSRSAVLRNTGGHGVPDAGRRVCAQRNARPPVLRTPQNMHTHPRRRPADRAHVPLHTAPQRCSPRPLSCRQSAAHTPSRRAPAITMARTRCRLPPVCHIAYPRGTAEPAALGNLFRTAASTRQRPPARPAPVLLPPCLSGVFTHSGNATHPQGTHRVPQACCPARPHPLPRPSRGISIHAQTGQRLRCHARALRNIYCTATAVPDRTSPPCAAPHAPIISSLLGRSPQLQSTMSTTSSV